MLNGGDEVLHYCKEISAREHEADDITREVLTALRRTFITPLDRGDIKDLITSMDDAIDQMNRTAKVTRLFEIRTSSPPCKTWANSSSARPALAWRRFRCYAPSASNGRLNVLTEKIIRLEESADELHDRAARSCS